MTTKELLELLGCIGDRHIEETAADMEKSKKSIRKPLYAVVSVAACAVLVIGVVFAGGFEIWKSDKVLPLDEEETTAVTNSQRLEVPLETEYIGETETSAPTYSVPPTDSGSWMKEGNGWMIVYCFVHHESYHCFTDSLMEYVGYEEFHDWFDSGENTDKTDRSYCWYPDRSIKSFIDYFDIPREVFKEKCGTDIHNLDLLYSDDLDAIDAYYRDFEALVFRERSPE